MSPDTERKKSILRNGKGGTVHPEIGDIEAGVNRVKFCKSPPPVDDKTARRMVRNKSFLRSKRVDISTIFFAHMHP
jgi:hypothetical protein